MTTIWLADVIETDSSAKDDIYVLVNASPDLTPPEGAKYIQIVGGKKGNANGAVTNAGGPPIFGLWYEVDENEFPEIHYLQSDEVVRSQNQVRSNGIDELHHAPKPAAKLGEHPQH